VGPASRTHAALDGPLPRRAPPARLFGRDGELAAAGALLREAGARLLTLTGPAGVGKTSLALRLVAALAAQFAAGACVASLAGVDDSGFVAEIVAALGLDATAAVSLDGLIRVLRPQELLLVLDGLDHVSRAAVLVAELAAACPGLAIVATKRARLRLSFEQELPIAPLPPPAAVELFCERARAVRPEFALDERNADAVRAVCDRLDCLPLALELAALRLKVLTPQTLLERLDDELDLLTDAPLDAPAHHRTLRLAVDWSVDRLGGREALVFRRLAAFPDGFTIEAADAVCAPDVAPVLPALERLVDESLVTRVETGGDGVRLAMLRTIRAAALARLRAAGEEDAVRRAAAEHLRSLADHSLARLEQERENLAAAERWLSEAGHHEAALSLTLIRGRLALARGPAGDVAELAAALARPGGHELAALLDAVAGVQRAPGSQPDSAMLALRRGDFAAALELSRDDPVLQGIALWAAGRYADARPVLEAALPDAVAGVALAATLVATGERHDEALASALASAERIDDRRALAACRLVAGWTAEPSVAAALYEQALALGEALGDVAVVDACVATAAATLPTCRDARIAARLLGAAGGRPRPALLEAALQRADAAARGALGGAAFAAEQSAGRGLSPREAIALYEAAARASAAGYPCGLSGREVEVLRLVASGLTDAEVARELVLSVRTVHTHLRSVYRKIGVGSRAAATRFALEQQLA
jgi:predicted ATPase/DNA-binding CsgD family transcriptional regulator